MFFQSTSRDLQRLILNTCRQTWCASTYQMQPAPSPKRWIGKQRIRVQLKHCESKLRTQMRPTWVWRLKVLKFVSRRRKQGSHKQTGPLDNWLSAKQCAGERGDSGFPQDLSKSKSRICMSSVSKHVQYVSNDPLWPSLQLVSLGPNALIAEMWEPNGIFECSKAGKASTYQKRPVASSNMLRWAWAKIARDGMFDLASTHLVDQLGAV